MDLDFKNEYNWQDKTILVAEDEDINYIFIEEALLDTNARVIRAENGIEAVSCIKEQKIDMVLMDIKMPQMNGFEATKIIKEYNKNIPIIAQTAYALAGEKEKILASGCDDYISKPILQNVLLKTMIKYFK